MVCLLPGLFILDASEVLLGPHSCKMCYGIEQLVHCEGRYRKQGAEVN